jgi:hypothetical protein
MILGRWRRGAIIAGFAAVSVVLYALLLTAAFVTGLFLCCAVGCTAALARLRDRPEDDSLLTAS